MKAAEHRRDDLDRKTWRDHRDVIAPATIIAAAFAVVALVWVLTGWWSFAEQRDSAAGFGFDHPAILFWSTDGFAIGCALVALAAAVDNRPAPFARAGVVVALAVSAWFNAGGTVDRIASGDWGATPLRAIVMAAAIPIVSLLALEVIIAAIRATVRRWRGLPAPVGVPSLRFGRLLLAPKSSFVEWRQMYLDRTKPGALQVATVDDLRAEITAARDEAAESADGVVDQLRAQFRSDLDNLREEIPQPVPAPPPIDLTAERDKITRAVQFQLDRYDRESRERFTTAVDEAVRTARTAAAETARAVAEEHRPTGTTGQPRTGTRTGGRTGTASGTKRDRYEQAYRSLVESGTDPAEITGRDIARTAGFPEDDADGMGRKTLRALRPDNVVPIAQRERERA